MALGFLKIIFTILILMALIGQILLYSNWWTRFGVTLNTVLGILISYLSYTSLPSNYLAQKGLALALGIIAALAFILGWRSEKKPIIIKIMLTISVVGGILHLLI